MRVKFFNLEKKVAEPGINPAHQVRIQSARKHKPDLRGTVPKRPIPYQTKPYRSVETGLNSVTGDLSLYIKLRC